MELGSAKNGSSETASRISVLENQVMTLSSDVEKLEETIDLNYATLHSRISALRDDVTTNIDTKHEKLMEKLDSQSKSSSEQHKVIAEKVQQLEKWRWMLMGGAAVIGYILAHLRLEKFF